MCRKKKIIIIVAILIVFMTFFIVNMNLKRNKLAQSISNLEFIVPAGEGKHVLDNWNKYGISYLAADEESVVKGYKELSDDADLMNDILWGTSSGYGYIHFHRYNNDEIESAINAMVYGCEDDEHPTSYDSIIDIPMDLRLEISVQYQQQLQSHDIPRDPSFEQLYHSRVIELEKKDRD